MISILNPVRRRPWIVAFAFASGLVGSAWADRQSHFDFLFHRDNIVTDVVSAPVVSNGIVAGEPTEINIFLNAAGSLPWLAFDSRRFGHQVPAGGRMEIELGGSFERNGVDNDLTFAAVSSNAQLILTNGHPQNPIASAAGSGVHQANYTIEDDGKKRLTVRPNGGNGANGLENARAVEIGVKVIHIRPPANQSGANFVSPFRNGPAGTRGTVSVRIFDANDRLVESGHGSVIFRGRLGPQVYVTNAGLTENVELAESTNFQRVAPGTMMFNSAKRSPFSAGAPYAPRFLLFDAIANQPDSFIPQKGLAAIGYVVNVDQPWRARIVRDTNANGTPDTGDDTIGHLVLVGFNREGERGRILESAALTVSGDGVSGDNGSVMSVPVQVGGARGYYFLIAYLDGGGFAINTTVAE